MESEKRVYLKFGICEICVKHPLLKEAANATLDDVEPYVAFNRRARTTKGLPGTEARRRREKRHRGLTNEQVRWFHSPVSDVGFSR